MKIANSHRAFWKVKVSLLVVLFALFMSTIFVIDPFTHTAHASSRTSAIPNIGTVSCPYGITNTQVTTNLIPDMETLQACWVRLQINMSDIGTDPNFTNWGTLDSYINQLSAVPIHIDAVIRCVAGKTNCFSSSPTLPSTKAMTDFATAIAKRYGSKIESYEILNEEMDQFSGTSQLSKYCPILQAGYNAIKANSTATVGMYGTYKVNSTHLNGVVQALQSCKGFMDYANMHYYAMGGDPNNPISGQLSFMQAVNILQGLGKPIWVTETGWPVSNANIVTYMNEEMDDARTSGGAVTHVFWYTLDFPQQNPPQPDDIHGTAAFTALENYIAAHPTWP